MARANTHRIEVKGVLVGVSPLLVGGGSTPGMDVTPLQDGMGRFIIPGTSLTGVLRHHFLQSTENADESLIQIFGDNESADGGASSLTIFDAVCIDLHPRLSVRDGVGIDRVSGTAAKHIKFDQLVLDLGTRFSFDMRVEWAEGNSKNENNAKIVERLVTYLVSGELRLGRGNTRALGRFRLDEAQTRTIDLRNREQVMMLARSLKSDVAGAPWVVGPQPTSTQKSAKNCRITIDWSPTTPVMSAESLVNAGVDIVPRMALRQENDTFTLHSILPGTSIKGVIRSACEYIVRTLRKDSAPEGFLEQLDYPPLSGLFGTTDRGSSISVDDVLSRPVLSSTDSSLLSRWEEVIAERGEDKTRLKNLRDELEKLRSSSKSALLPPIAFIPTAHVALNRWTSAPVDGALYSVLEIHNLEWNPIVIDIDLSRLAAPWNADSLSTLFLILFDRMVAGEIPLGFGGNRGLGSYRINAVTVDTTGEIRLKEIVERFSGEGLAGFLDLLKDSERKILSDAIVDVTTFNSERVAS